MHVNAIDDALGDLVDRDTAARLLGVVPRTLDRWHLQRRGPPRVRIGRKVRYRRRSLSDWVRDHER
ncbi:helix-turn-helix transcriptional regulator [Bradyrhizobium ottawaense]